MRIIDPHVHVWKNDPQFPWAKERRNHPTKDATAEMLLELMEANGVEKTVIVQVIHYLWDNRYAADAIKRYPDKFMGVCRINPEDPEAPDHLSKWTEDHGFHGVRLSPSTGSDGDWFKGQLMPPIFSRAEDLCIPLLILTKAERLVDLIPLIEKHPDLNIVIDHMADCSPEEPVKLKLLLDLARFQNVYVKISHTWSISKASYPWVDTHEQVKKVYHSFGGPRIMWGTDWPVCLSRATYPQTLSVVHDEMDFFTSEDREWVLGKTALQLWSFGGN